MSNVASIEREGKYIQHNVGALGFDDQGDVEEYYLVNETEKRLNTTLSTTSFQTFEMKENTNSPVSKVRG